MRAQKLAWIGLNLCWIWIIYPLLRKTGNRIDLILNFVYEVLVKLKEVGRLNQIFLYIELLFMFCVQTYDLVIVLLYIIYKLHYLLIHT